MQAALYWLEDHFDARAARSGRSSAWISQRLSRFFANLGDALAAGRPHRHAPGPFLKSR